MIGINSAIASLSSGASGESGSIGVGFAIPIDQAKRIAEEIVKTGKASHAVLGASVGDATVDGNALLTSGAKVSQLTSGGGAEKAGLQVGDVITKVGDQKIESADALVAAIRSAAPNSTVEDHLHPGVGQHDRRRHARLVHRVRHDRGPRCRDDAIEQDRPPDDVRRPGVHVIRRSSVISGPRSPLCSAVPCRWAMTTVRGGFLTYRSSMSSLVPWADRGTSTRTS